MLYAPMKLFKTKNRIVYLSRQSNDKSVDMLRLERAVSDECPEVRQIFRLRMIPATVAGKIKYCFGVAGDMYYLATSRVAVLDTYSIPVSCLKHKKQLKVIQMWHAMGAVKKFGLQCVGTKEGRDEKISRAMCMHKNYDYVLAPSKATAAFYMEAFGCQSGNIKICSLPRVDELLSETGAAASFFSENPGLSQKKIVFYLPTFRHGEEAAVRQLQSSFENEPDYHLIISTHPLFSRVVNNTPSYKGNYSTYDLMKVANIIITDYSACAFEASITMKPLYFFVPDYESFSLSRGINVDVKAELPLAAFENAQELINALKKGDYDFNSLFSFKSRYVENTGANNAAVLAKFIAMLIKSN